MTGLEQLAVLAAGLVAGILTSTVGVASLLSFPVLVAVGLPPVVANASNTVGMTPAGLSGSFGYRARAARAPARSAGGDRDLRRRRRRSARCCCSPCRPGVFEAVVPWLILVTCLLVGVQPRISPLAARRRARSPTRRTAAPDVAGHDRSSPP